MCQILGTSPAEKLILFFFFKIRRICVHVMVMLAHVNMQNFLFVTDIQSWWEVPSIAHFCSLFRAAFNLLDFDIEVRKKSIFFHFIYVTI
jgi:hypothetical protein